MKYYAVKVGKKTGIYETWDECKNNVDGFAGAIYKSFSSKEDAMKFLNDEKQEIKYDIPTAYVDGSFDINTNRYSFGAVLIIGDKIYKYKKAFDEDEFSLSRNVSGEIKGAAFIINKAIKLNIKELNLYYDYQGIEEFYFNRWNAEKKLPKLYQEFAKEAKEKIKVNFIKVKSHTNNFYNDMVDLLAKEALGL